MRPTFLPALIAALSLTVLAPARPALAEGICVTVAHPDQAMRPPGPITGPAAAIDRTLREIARTRDMAAFTALIVPRAEMGFGGESGPKGFQQAWARDAEATTHFWTALDRMLAMGGVTDADGALVYPWTDELYHGDLDPFSTYFDVEGRVYTRDVENCGDIPAPETLYFMVGPRMLLEPVAGRWSVTVLVEGD